MFKNILFATDLSPLADKSLPYAVEIARRFHSTFYAVHVFQPYPAAPETTGIFPELLQVEQNLREESKHRLDQELAGIPHELMFLEGGIWPNLSHVITEKDINLIVMGTHGRSGIEKLALGSVAEEIFRQAACPVLTVGPRVPNDAPPTASAGLNRILYATDFSAESLAAAPYAISLAKEHRAELILMHAIQSLKPAQINTAFQTLRDVIPLGTCLALRPRYLVERGGAEKAILGVAEKHNADLIVLGVQRAKINSILETHFAQSIAYGVVANADCPVLTIRG